MKTLDGYTGDEETRSNGGTEVIMGLSKRVLFVMALVLAGLFFTGCPTPGDTAWHEIGAPGEPAFLAGWHNVGSSYSTAAFRIDGITFYAEQ